MTFAKKRIIFCDFDGTITINDNIVEMMKHFNPDGWEPIVSEIIERKRSVRNGISALFALFPADMRRQIVDYVMSQAVIRPGFHEFLEYTQTHGIQFIVTSGGIDFFVYPILKPYRLLPSQIYCNGSDFAGSVIRITWPHACDDVCSNDCGMCKTRIMRRYDPSHYYRIVIGDSVTDFGAAQLADIVYARSYLLKQCRYENINHVAYETFHDIIAHLKQEVPSQ